MNYAYVNGVRVYAPSSRRALIEHAFDRGGVLVAVNAEKIAHATEQMRGIINSNLGYPDGLGAVLGLRKKGHGHVVKMAGCELWLDIVKMHFRNKSFYLVGARSSVIEATVAGLRSEFPGIQILAHRDGYIQNDAERRALVKDVIAKSPDVVFVAMGSPAQEILMQEMREVHPAVYMGLGGSFDVYTGRVRRAPSWWVNSHLEWLYRLLQEPSRVKRQVHLVGFLVRLYSGKF